MCPVCRKEEKLPQEGVRDLPAAHHLSSIIEVAEMLNIKDTSTELVSGKECSTEKCGKIPVAWCATECGYLCEECSDNHSKMRVTKSHDMRLIKELQKDQDIPLFCKRHKEQYRQYHCMDCKKLVCHECLQYCSDCRKLICGDCLNEHGYPNDPEDVLSLTTKKSGIHNVHLLKNLIEHGKATEIELEKEECELKLFNKNMKLYISDLKRSFEKIGVSLDDQIISRQKDCTKRRKELGMAGQTACEFISDDRIVSAPEQAFQVLMEYSANSSSSEHGVAKMWLFWSPNEPQSLEMIEQIQPQHIKVKFPIPFRMSRDNWFLISLTNLLPVRPSGNPPLPVVSIKGVLTETNYSCSIEPVDNAMAWFVLFNANEIKIEVDVVFEGVRAERSPFNFQDDPDDPKNIDDRARMNDIYHMNRKTINIPVLQICLISCIIIFIILLLVTIAYAYT